MEWMQKFFEIPPDASLLTVLLLGVRRLVSLFGCVIIAWGTFVALYQFLVTSHKHPVEQDGVIDVVRVRFGRTIILGLEFIVAADIIATTYAPNFYSVGILAALVGIRIFLNYFMNLELRSLLKK